MKILVVEDDEQLRELLSIFLSELNYQVQTTNNVPVAMELIKESAFDIVLTDKNIEGLDGNIEGGMDVLRYVRTHHKPTEVIMMTGYATIETAIEALKLGAFDYIMKPFKLDDLKAKIERIGEYKKMMDPENTMLTYKSLHNEILDLMQGEKNLNDDEMKGFLAELDQQIDQFFQQQKRWNISWYNIKKSNGNGTSKK